MKKVSRLNYGFNMTFSDGTETVGGKFKITDLNPRDDIDPALRKAIEKRVKELEEKMLNDLRKEFWSVLI